MGRKAQRVILEKLKDRKVARIVLNRPNKHNAIDLRMIEEWMQALEEVRNDDAVRVVVTKGNGPSFGSGLDLYYLRSISQAPPADWERSSLPRTLSDRIREYPKVTIAQVHGYCLGHAMVNMCSHDLAFAAATAQIGMPEILRGSFGQMATANLFHSGIPVKKAAMMQLTGRYISGAEADRLGLVSQAVDEKLLDGFTLDLASEIATHHPAALGSAKIAVQMGGKLGLADAMKMDQLVGAWQQLSVDPLSEVESYLSSQAGGPNRAYKRRDS
jgi:enoyl-CoA hydratase/carnithine racemase